MTEEGAGKRWADSPKAMAYMLAALFFAGATTGAMVILLPHNPAADEAMLWTNVALAIIAAALLAGLAGRLPPWSLNLAVAAGTLVITRAVVLGHEPGDIFALWYVWVGLYAFFFFGRRAGIAQIALIGACYAWALTQEVQTSPVARWVMMVGTIAIGGLLVDILATRLRGAARASGESEQKVRSIVESATEAFLSVDSESRIIDWNPAAERMFGYSREDAIGRSVDDLIVLEQERKTRREEREQFMATGEGPIGEGDWLEGTTVRNDGSEIAVEAAVSRVESEGQWILHAFLHDVTKRRAEEEAARRLATIVESSDDAIIGITTAAKVTSWNRGAEHLYGWSEEEIVGQEMAALVPEDRWEEVIDILGRLAQGGRVEQIETQRLAKDGSIVDVSVTYSPIKDESGTVTGASVIARGIGERLRLERYTAAQHAATRVLAETPGGEDAGLRLLPILVEETGWDFGAWWVANEDGSELSCAATTLAIEAQLNNGTPFSVGERGVPIRDAIWVEDLGHGPELPSGDAIKASGMDSAVWLPVASRGVLFGAFELAADGTRKRDDELLARLETLAGQFAAFAERRRAEEEAERIKGEFLGLVSHELRTPLTSIIGYTELLLDVEAEGLSERQREFLEVVRRNGERELRLVGDLLLLVMIEAGSFSIELDTVELGPLVKECVNAARPRAEAEQVELRVETEDVPELNGDGDRIAQVIDNLLSNALKFTEEGGEVVVRLRAGEGNAVIEVQDSGIGIPKDEQERLFDRLFRASGATEMHIPGIGVGLTIVKALVEAHGGEVSVESVEGEGTTFRVALPLELPDSVTDLVVEPAVRSRYSAATGTAAEGRADSRR